MSKIRVLVADDQEIIRDGLAFILNRTDDIEVVAMAEDGEQAITLARQHQPDVVLMDIKMPRLDGIAATRAITSELPGARVIILTTYDTDDLVFDGVRAGAHAYLLKGTRSARLAEAIRGVHAGEAQLDPQIALKVMEEFRRICAIRPDGGSLVYPQAGDTAPEALPLESLTAREMEIVALLAEGLSNKDIAARLFLTEGTVKNYVSSIMAKLHANDRTQVVVKAAQRRMVRLG
jgi:DNA-binding NarL/FixJ family response regulator